MSETSIPIAFRHTDCFDHYSVIELFAKIMRPNYFVEYGVFHGEVVEKVYKYCNAYIGVDKKDNRPSNIKDISNFKFYEMTTREFYPILDDMKIKIDMAFIDAWHSLESAFQDFENIFPHVSDNGIVFMHDTFPAYEIYLQPNFCNDCWKTVPLIKQKYNGKIEIITLPFLPGLTIIRKLGVSLPWMDDKSIDVSGLIKEHSIKL